jgi:hypothetical protein
MTVPTKAANGKGDIIESVIAKGDLSRLTSDERNTYYREVCRSLGLNPLTQPFSYITLNGKLALYAKRDAADQLRKLNGISIEIVSQEMSDNLLTVHVRAKDASGRQDEDLGSVAFVYPNQYKDKNGEWRPHPKAGKPLENEDRANAILKAVTKAKRRVTLSICGLGFLDETEVADIPASAKQLPPHDAETGEVTEDVEGFKPITAEQVQNLRDMITASKSSTASFLKWAQAARLEDIPAEHYDSCVEALQYASKERHSLEAVISPGAAAK